MAVLVKPLLILLSLNAGCAADFDVKAPSCPKTYSKLHILSTEADIETCFGETKFIKYSKDGQLKSRNYLLKQGKSVKFILDKDGKVVEYKLYDIRLNKNK
ncbi:hypothetical protein [Paraferrimonas sp. SM1919]|uniref:hypothetical protein n=1 Tax=Paraferrimonas sp. SM1919 TaxID=2662263 RepID=UPI0013CF629A|nr:hypothetical protein [Paraferrimonas sp. SM1919]